MAIKQRKPFLTFSQQIQNLEVKKSLTIKDHSFALSKLQDICYYALIDGYKDLFYNPMERKYISGTTFEDIVALYEFDEKLRTVIFTYLCHIEQKMRSLISYHFCIIYTEDQTAYLNPANYNNSRKNAYGIAKLVNILNTESVKNKEHPYVVYQRNTYNNVPLWVIMNTLTFGQMSQMYSFLTSGIKTKISLSYPTVSEKELMQFLRVLTNFRNVCAHNERLFSFRCRFEIPNTNLHKKLAISQTGNQYDCGKNDLFAIVIAFRYLLNRQDFLSFKRDINSLLKKFYKASPSTNCTVLLNAMGFPKNWTDITRYRL